MTREQVNSIWRFRDAIEYARRSGMALFLADGALYLLPDDIRQAFEAGLLDHEALMQYRLQLSPEGVSR